ncbi:MAG: hypothetical protein U0822_22520 [Anaerolineae bacterium]
MTRVSRAIVVIGLFALSLSLSGCGLLSRFLQPQTPAASAPAVVAPPPAPPQPAQPAAPAIGGPAGQAGIGNFTARFNGRSVEGSFTVGNEAVNYVYRLQRFDVVDGRLQVTGGVSYTRSSGGQGSIPNVAAAISAQDEACQQLTLDTQPIPLPDFGTTLPAQHKAVNMAGAQGASSGAAQMMCQLVQGVQNNPNNPLIRVLLDQVNKQLQ